MILQYLRQASRFMNVALSLRCPSPAYSHVLGFILNG